MLNVDAKYMRCGMEAVSDIVPILSVWYHVYLCQVSSKVDGTHTVPVTAGYSWMSESDIDHISLASTLL